VQVHCAHYTVQCRNIVYTSSAKCRLHYRVQFRNTVYTTRSESQFTLLSTLLKHSAHITVRCRNTVYTISAKMQVTLQSAMQKYSVMHTTLHNELCVTALLWAGTQCCNVRYCNVRRRRRQLLFQCQWPHQCQETVVH